MRNTADKWVGTCVLALGLATALGAPDATSATVCSPQPNSNVGCNFYAVSLPNLILQNQTSFHFGVAMLNSGAVAVGVTVTGGALVSPDAFSIPAGSSITRQLPWVSGISMSSATAKTVGGAYHITSTGPISALQLNATEPEVFSLFSQSNDASLLIPVESAGTSYRAVVWPTWSIVGNEYPGFIAVVANTAATSVQVVAPGTIQPGAGLSANGGTVSLDQGDVLLIASALDATSFSYGSDLSGTQITSSAAVLVWTGHAGADIDAGTGYADHLEESLPPVSALGDDYLIVRPSNPSGSPAGARHYVKVVGTMNGTTLTTTPPISGAPLSLNAGSSGSFEVTVDFRLHSSSPVVVGLFMEGSATTGFGNVGDPSQSIAVPTFQGRRSIDFTAPISFAPIFAQLVAPTGTTISVDSANVSGWSAIGSSGYSVATVPLCCTEEHHATGDQPFSLTVHAYPPGNTSYWYPGGLGIDDVIFRDGFD